MHVKRILSMLSCRHWSPRWPRTFTWRRWWWTRSCTREQPQHGESSSNLNNADRPPADLRTVRCHLAGASCECIFLLVCLQMAVLLHTLGGVFTAIAVTATAILIKMKGRSHTSGSCRSAPALPLLRQCTSHFESLGYQVFSCTFKCLRWQ